MKRDMVFECINAQPDVASLGNRERISVFGAGMCRDYELLRTSEEREFDRVLSLHVPGVG